MASLQASLLDNSESEPAEEASGRESEPVVAPVVLVDSQPNRPRLRPRSGCRSTPARAPAVLDESSFADLKLDLEDDLIGGTDPMGLPRTVVPEALDRQARDLAVGGSASGAQTKPGAAKPSPACPLRRRLETSAPLPVLALQCGPSTSRSASRARIYIPSRCPRPRR